MPDIMMASVESKNMSAPVLKTSVYPLTQAHKLKNNIGWKWKKIKEGIWK